jgi:hypothetical protein
MSGAASRGAEGQVSGLPRRGRIIRRSDAAGTLMAPERACPDGVDGRQKERPGGAGAFREAVLLRSSAYCRPVLIALASVPFGSSPLNSQKNAPPRPCAFT